MRLASMYEFDRTRFDSIRLTNSATDSNHTNLPGFEATVKTLILVIRVGEDLDIADVVCD
jgi:hypothetical protein